MKKTIALIILICSGNSFAKAINHPPADGPRMQARRGWGRIAPAQLQIHLMEQRGLADVAVRTARQRELERRFLAAAQAQREAQAAQALVEALADLSTHDDAQDME